LPEAALQTWAVRSELAVTTRAPSGLNAALFTGPDAQAGVRRACRRRVPDPSGAVRAGGDDAGASTAPPELYRGGESLADRVAPDRDATGVALSSSAATDRGRDSARIEALAEIRVHTAGPLVLVTRDGRLTREARAAGVDAGDPETVAARTMTREAGRRAMFESRLHDAMERYVARGPLNEWLLRIQAMENLARVYRAVWTPPNQPWFLPPPT
jgi:hypothetical protein